MNLLTNKFLEFSCAPHQTCMNIENWMINYEALAFIQYVISTFVYFGLFYVLVSSSIQEMKM